MKIQTENKLGVYEKNSAKLFIEKIKRKYLSRKKN